MDISLERIRAKIVELEAKLSDLRIVERELESLEKHSARKTRIAPGPKPKRKPEATDQAEARQTIGAAIADVLGRIAPFRSLKSPSILRRQAKCRQQVN
jgi:hypothetical protein